MKVRKGFVSNSSSSSYQCEVCGEEISGYDVSLRDGEMFECAVGHICCQEHILASEEEWDQLKEDGDWPYEVDAKFCPICQMKSITDYDLLRYALNKLGTNKKDLEAEMKEKFSNLAEFHKIVP